MTDKVKSLSEVTKKPNDDVSEAMLTMARQLRHLARQIEEGVVTGVALAFVDYTEREDESGVGGYNVGTSHACQYGSYTLGGGILQMQYVYSQELSNDR